MGLSALRRSAQSSACTGPLCFLFAAALLSKTVTCTLPAALLLVLWWKGQKPMRRTAVTLAPFFALGVAMSGVTMWMEKHSVGALGGQSGDLSLVERGLIAGRALWFYAAKLLLPLNLYVLSIPAGQSMRPRSGNISIRLEP